MSAIYLYGFGRPAPLDGWTAEGIEPGTHAAVWPFGEVAAVVSDVTPGTVAPGSDRPTPEEQNRLVAQALRHEHVVEAVLARSPVLPVRYGAVFSSRQALEQLLAAHADRIAGFLDRVQGREEWAVKGRLNTQRATAWVLETDPELAGRKAQLPDAPGARYFHEKKLQSAAEKRLNERLAAVAGEVRQQLLAWAEEWRPLRRAAPPEGGPPLAYHEAFLFPAAARPEWQARLDVLAERHAPAGLTLTCTGPWPPFNFAPSFDESAA